MSITDSEVKKLIAYLQKANTVDLYETEDSHVPQEDGSYIKIKGELWGGVAFPVNIYSEEFYNLFKNFKLELTSNTYDIGFNINKYYNRVIRKCESITNLFETLKINGIDVRVRNDSIFKYYEIGKVETFFDTEGDPYDILRPTLLKTVPWNDLKPEILKKITDYFSYQEKVIDRILDNPLFSQVKRKRDGSKAPKSGYMIKTEFLKNISDFNEELKYAKLIDDKTKSNMWYIFFEGNLPQQKINWVGKKPANCLWYFITKLKEVQVIKAFPKQQWKHLADIFTFNGQNIQPDFYKNHNFLNKNNKIELDQAFEILKS